MKKKAKIHYGQEDYIMNGFVVAMAIFALIAMALAVTN